MIEAWNLQSIPKLSSPSDITCNPPTVSQKVPNQPMGGMADDKEDIDDKCFAMSVMNGELVINYCVHGVGAVLFSYA